MGACGVGQQAHGQFQVAVITDLHGDGDTHLAVSVGIIAYHRTDQQFVRHQDFRAGQGAQYGESRGDACDLAAVAADADHVPDTYRVVEQKNETGYIIAGDFLQAKTQADAECATKYRQRGQVDTHQRQGDQHSDQGHERARQAHENHAQAAVHIGRPVQPRLKGIRQPQRDKQRRSDGHQALQHLPQVERGLADGQRDEFQHIDDIRQETEDMQGNDYPGNG